MNRAHAPTSILDFLFQFWTARALIAAANLGVADHIQSMPRHIDQIAHDMKVDANCLLRLLRGLTAVHIFQETADSYFSHTPTSELLRTEAPEKMRDVLRAFNFHDMLKAWADLEDIIRTGEPVLSSDKVWDVFSGSQESTIYQNAMSTNTEFMVAEFLNVCDFSEVHRVADIGGGHGVLLAAILQKYPQVQGVLLERPEVLNGAKSFLQAAGLSERCALISANFHHEVPKDCDVYLIKNILHGLKDEEALALFQRIHKLSETSTRLLICEVMLPEDNSPHIGKIFDLFMLLGASNTRVRRLSEVKSLLYESGFELASNKATSLGASILECHKI